jgi:hypothetical protein
MAASQYHLDDAWLQHVLLAMLVFSTEVEARCKCYRSLRLTAVFDLFRLTSCLGYGECETNARE